MTRPIRPRGIGDADWAQFLQDHEKSERALLTHRCPRCGAKILRKPTQGRGDRSSQPGTWVTYTCFKKCGWFMDRKETN